MNEITPVNSTTPIAASDMAAPVKEQAKQEKSAFYELMQILFFAVVFAYIIRIFVIQPLKIPTGSMEDTLLIGDFLLVNKFVYGAKTPDRIPLTDIEISQWQLPAVRAPRSGDVIVFKFPPDPTVNYIKRCIATEGQTIEIKDKVLSVDGVPFKDFCDPLGLKFEDPEIISRDKGYEAIYPKGAGSRDNYGPVTVPHGYLFAMGDNRDRSYDSRQWGFVPMENLIGKAIMIFWSTASDNNLDIRWDRIGKGIE